MVPGSGTRPPYEQEHPPAPALAGPPRALPGRPGSAARTGTGWTAPRWGTLGTMTPVPASPDPESGPPAVGRRRATVPALSTGALEDVGPGSLLVAMPGLSDPTFAGAVVYVLDHSSTGTLGVVLGSPSQVQIRDVLPGWGDLAVGPAVFHVGGPCEADTALCLARCAGPGPGREAGLRPVADDVYLVDLDADPEPLAAHVAGLRVFAGYAGWSPGQLAGEVAEGAWACLPGMPDDVLTELSGPRLWRAVLSRQSGRHAVLRTAPADPTAN